MRLRGLGMGQVIHFYRGQAFCSSRENISAYHDALMRCHAINAKSFVNFVPIVTNYECEFCKALIINKVYIRIICIMSNSIAHITQKLHAMGGRGSAAVRANLYIIITPPTKFFAITPLPQISAPSQSSAHCHAFSLVYF